MFYKVATLLCIAGLVSASNFGHPVAYSYVSSTPSTVTITPPVSYARSPSIISYSSAPIVSKSSKFESFQAVTAHPPAVAYTVAPTPAPYVAAKTVLTHAEPQYVVSTPSPYSVTPAAYSVGPAAYSVTPAAYAVTPAPYAASPVVVKKVAHHTSYTPVVQKFFQAPQPVVKYVSAPSVKTVVPAVQYQPVTTYAASPVVQKYVSAPLVKSLASSYSYAPLYVNSEPIEVPVHYPVAVESETPLVYSSPVTYSKQVIAKSYSPYYEEPAYTTYAKAHTYSSAPAVSHVSFNGLGVSYAYKKK